MNRAAGLGRCARGLAAGLLLAVGTLRATPAGRWNLEVVGESIRFPAWLEIASGGSRPSVRYVGRVGSVREIREFDLNNDSLRFSRNEWFGAYEMVQHSLRFDGDRVTGVFRRVDGSTLAVAGCRARSIDRPLPRRWAGPQPLFNGHDFTGWLPVKGADPSRNWRVERGALVTSASGGDLRTVETYGDFRLHFEFNCPADGNSGVYLRGRYELQIEEDSARAPLSQQTGGIYGWLGPESPVPRRPGAWRTVDLTLVGRRVTVVLDGQTLFTDQEIPGITGGALDGAEEASGPIVLQASHSRTRGEVRFRNLTIALPDEEPAARRSR